MPGESTPMLKPDRQRQLAAVYVGFIFPAIAGFLYGYDIGAASGVVDSFQIKHPLTSWNRSVLTAASLFGAVPASILILWVGEPLGRRREILLASVLYFVGSAWSITAFGDWAYSWALVGRIIYGFGIAFAMHAAPAYIAEMAPAELRGSLVSLKEGFIVCGILFAYCVAALTEFMRDPGEQWRVIWGVLPLTLSPVIFWGMYKLPPSPRWLVQRGYDVEAHDALRKFREDRDLPCLHLIARVSPAKPPGGEATLDSFEKDVSEEVADMKASLLRAKRQSSMSRGVDLMATEGRAQDRGGCCGEDDTAQWLDLVSVPRALLVGVGLVTLQQVTGQPNVLYYVQSIFESAGFSTDTAKYVDILLGVVKLVATLSIVPLVDSSGRLPLLYLGTLVMGVSMLVISLAWFLNPAVGPDTSVVDLSGGWSSGVVVALIAYVVGYQVGFGPVTWVMISETFPLQVRARALACASTVNFGVNLAVVLLNGPLSDSKDGQTVLFFVYTGMCCFSMVYFFFFVPETKGKTLEEIDAMMRKPLCAPVLPRSPKTVRSSTTVSSSAI